MTEDNSRQSELLPEARNKKIDFELVVYYNAHHQVWVPSLV